MFDLMLENKALIFTIPALLGTGVFLLKLLLMGLGGLSADVDLDADVDVDLDAEVSGAMDAGDTGVVGAGDSTAAFALLSIQSVAALLMGFGWGGLGGIIGLDWAVPQSLLLGLGIGGGMMWLMGLIFKAMYDLQSSGNINIRDAQGAEGVVYAEIPAKSEGRGQVRIVMRGRQRLYNAYSDGESISSQSRIRVVRVNDDNTLTVSSA